MKESLKMRGLGALDVILVMTVSYELFVNVHCTCS